MITSSLSPHAVKRHFATNALWNALPLVVGAVAGLSVLAFAIPRLGLASYGVYVMMMAACSPLVLLLFGIPDALIRSIAKSLGAQQASAATATAQTGTALIIVSALLSAVAAATLLPPASAFVLGLTHAPPADFPLTNCALAVATMTLLQQLGAAPTSVLSATQRFRSLGLCIMAQTVSTAGLQALALEFGLGVTGFAWGASAGTAIALVLKLLVVGVPTGFGWFLPRVTRASLSELLVFGRWQTAAQLGGIASAQAERICLAAVLGPAATTSFDLCVRAQQPLYAFVFQATQALFPFLSSRSHDGVAANMRLAMRAGWISTVATAMVLTPLGGLSYQLMALWMGEGVAKMTSPIMTVLAFAGVIGATTNAPYQLLLSQGRTRALATISFVTGIVNVGSALLLLPTFGLQVAGVPALLSMLAQWCWVNLIISRVTGIRVRDLASSSAGPVLASAFMIAVMKAIELSLPHGPVGWLTAVAGYVTTAGLLYLAFQGTSAGRAGLADIRGVLAALPRYPRAL